MIITGQQKQSGRITPLLAALISAVVTLIAVSVFFTFTGRNQPDSGNTTAQAIHEEHEGEHTLYTCGMHPWIISEEPGNCPICGMELTPKIEEGSGKEAADVERKIIYWRAPMDHAEIYEKPGKSKMGMDLVPVYEDEVIGGVVVKIDPATQQNMGIRTQTAVKGKLERSLRTYGHITYDETATAQISPKFSGWVEKLHVGFIGRMVGKGDPLFDIYSPELVTAQEEYLSAYRNLSGMKGEKGSDLLDSALRRLSFWDVPEDEIARIRETGKPRKALTIRSPFSGVVIMKSAEEGSYVKAGAMVFQIADLRRVWVEAHIFEYELPWIKLGQEVEMTLPYLPGKVYTGKVSFIYPYLQRATRDVIIRLEFDNPDLELKPEMFADVLIRSAPETEALIIPAEAVIRSGKRSLVFVTSGNGKFTPRDITLGLTLDNGRIQVLSGLAPGEEVVTSGQFLLDSESKLKEAVQKMLAARSGKSEDNSEPKEDDFFNDMEDDFFSDMEESEAPEKHQHDGGSAK